MKIKHIIESTVAGSIAPVATAMNGGRTNKRTKESVNVLGLQPIAKVMKHKAKKKGPYANSVIEEGKMKALDLDLKELSNAEFKKKYNKTKEEMKASLREAKIDEEDIILMPAKGQRLKTGFHAHDPDKAEREGETLKNSLHTIIRTATHLNNALSTQDNFPEWVSEKIGAIKSMMVSVMDYLVSHQEMKRDGDIEETGGVIAGGIAAETRKIDEQVPYAESSRAFKRWISETSKWFNEYVRDSSDERFDEPTRIHKALGHIYKTLMDEFGLSQSRAQFWALEVLDAYEQNEILEIGPSKNVDEVITKKTPAGEIISDFQKSKNKKFKGKSKAKRKEMALGAYYSMHPEKSKKKNKAK
jgi:hypothetical protein